MDLDDVKACLVGLLSSTKFAYNLKSLLKDFEEVSGCSLPLFGHSNSVEFLKSLHDTVRLSGDNLNPEVQLIVSKKSAHIVSLLDRQKVSSKFSQKHPLRRVIFNNSDVPENKKHSKLQGQENASVTSQCKKTTKIPDKLRNGEVLNKNLMCNGENRKITVNKTKNCNTVKISVQNEYFEKNPTDNRLLELNVQPTENFRSSASSCADNEVNDNVKNKLKDLIKEHSNGIWCCDLPKLFLKKYKYDLNFKEFGYTSLINMLSDLPEIFRCLRPGQDDWILFNASAPPSQVEKILVELNSKEKISKDVQKTLKSILNCSEIFQNGNVDLDAMLSLTSENEKSDYAFPNDVVAPQDTMADIDLNSHIPLGERINIYVAEVWSPSLFYIHLEKFSVHFRRFMYDLQQFYDIHISEYKMPDFVIKPKQICVGLYASDPQSPEEWYRLEIVDVISERMVIVNFVDFGTEALIKKNKLRFLHRAFQFFPIQGIAASLAGITSFDGKKDWSVSASAKLLDLTRQSKLQADVISIDCREKPIVNLIAYHSNNLSGPSLNKQLVDEKLAEIKGTILISRDKSYEKCMKTNNIVSQLVNSPKSAVKNPLHLEFAGKDTSTKTESNSINVIKDVKNEVDKNTNKKDDNFNEFKKEEKLISKNKEDVAEKSELVDLNLSSVQTIQPKPSNHDSSAEDFCSKITCEGIQINSKYNSSTLENPSQLTATCNSLPPGIEANKNQNLDLNLFQYLMLQEKEYSMKIINVALQFLNSNPLLKEIAVNDPESVLNIATEMSEAFLRKFSMDTIISKMHNSIQVSRSTNFSDFLLPSLNSNFCQKILRGESSLPSNDIATIPSYDNITFSSPNTDTLKARPISSPSANFEFMSDSFKNIFSVFPSQNISSLDVFFSSKVNIITPATGEVTASAAPVSNLQDGTEASTRDQSLSVSTHFPQGSNMPGQDIEKNNTNPKSEVDREENFKTVAPEELQTAPTSSACEKKTSSRKGSAKSKALTSSTSRIGVISKTKDVSTKGSANISSNLKNFKYLKEEKVHGKTIHIILKENIYACIEEIIESFTLFTAKGQVFNLLLETRSQYFDFKVLTWADDNDIMLEFMSCSSMDVFKKKRKKQKLNILPLSKIINFLKSLGCDTKPYGTQFEDLQEKYKCKMPSDLTVQ